LDRVQKLLEEAQPHPLAALYLSRFMAQVRNARPQALEILEAAAPSGEALVLNSLGIDYEDLSTEATGEQAHEHARKAYGFYQAAAAKGEPFGMTNVARFARNLGQMPPTHTYIEWLQRAVEADVNGVNNSYYYAIAYWTGTGVTRSVDEGRRWLTACAERGMPECQTLTGLDALRAAPLDGGPPLSAVRDLRRTLYQAGSSTSLSVLRVLGLMPEDRPAPMARAGALSAGLPPSFVLSAAKEILRGAEHQVMNFVAWSETPQGSTFWADESIRVDRGQGLSSHAKRIIAAWVAEAERRR
jgi:hypothetical protein